MNTHLTIPPGQDIRLGQHPSLSLSGDKRFSDLYANNFLFLK